jgi:pimeloyl-ACP methyl ester carboxylesterase
VPVGNAYLLKERIPGAELRIVEGGGHLFTFEFPEESASSIVEFLTRVPVTA